MSNPNDPPDVKLSRPGLFAGLAADALVQHLANRPAESLSEHERAELRAAKELKDVMSKPRNGLRGNTIMTGTDIPPYEHSWTDDAQLIDSGGNSRSGKYYGVRLKGDEWALVISLWDPKTLKSRGPISRESIARNIWGDCGKPTLGKLRSLATRVNAKLAAVSAIIRLPSELDTDSPCYEIEQNST
jgi:hypothetical protein